MKRKLFYIAFVTVFALGLGVAGTAAQEGSGSQNGDVVTAALDSAISYQGMLQESGAPVTGSRDMTFRLYSDDACTLQVGSNIVENDVPVANGLFSVELEVDAGDFNGQALWLEVEVGGAILGCQEILPAPYALSLRPGAKMTGNATGATFTAEHTGVGYGSTGVVGISSSTAGVGISGLASAADGGGVGVSGRSESTGGYGIYGYASSNSGVNYGVYGISDSGSGIGVYGQADDYGVQGKSFGYTGVGVYGWAADTSGQTIGVSGRSDSTAAWARGVYGYATATVGQTVGVEGKTDSGSDWTRGVFGYATAGSGRTFGVIGQVASSTNWANGVYGYASATTGQTVGVYGETASATDWARGVYGYATASDGYTFGVIGQSDSTDGVGLWAYGRGGAGGVFTTYNGNILEGWEELSVGGSTSLRFKVEYDGDVYTDGSYHCGVNDGGNATYVDENTGCMYDNAPADFAEMLPAARTLTPGDVLIIGPDGKLTLSSQPNQANVAGVYSTRPSYLGNSQYSSNPEYAPLAIVGVVPVKVTNESGEIKPGDLLTTSSLPGIAMKALPVDVGGGILIYRPGTIIGKALEGLQQKTGIILVLVVLQ